MGPLDIFIFTKVASTETLMFVLLVIFLVLLKKGARRRALALALSTVGLTSTVTIAKNYFQVPRPAEALVEASGYAFPSGHAAGAFFLAIILTSLAWNLSPRYKNVIAVGCIMLALAITYSRVILHVHTWSQVLVGACVGVFFGFLYIYFSKKGTKN